MIFHGADIGDGCRLGAGSIVHTSACLAARTRVGMRQFAIPQSGGGPAVSPETLTLRVNFSPKRTSSATCSPQTTQSKAT
jgi:carbonic anhydrase/acetyltransferase-like protein (isoleucine patch superfamily)